MDISSDGGLSWIVASTTLSGAVGNGVVPGLGKIVTWNAGTDFNSHQNSNMKIRVRGTDGFSNTSVNVLSAIFNLDTLAPTTLSQADLQAQPNAGDSAVVVGGSFTETNPITNGFFVAINGGAYNATTTGDANTATPSNQSTTVGATLVGHDYISKVKIIETDNYGHVGTNENVTPNASYQYVKPYTPGAPVVADPQNTSVSVAINANPGEANDVPYAIFENLTGKYVQANGSLGTSAVWQTAAVWGTKIITGLTSPVAQYSFKVKSRNPSDTAHAASSESAFSTNGAISNTAPVISITSASQVGSNNYVVVNYTGTDSQNDTNNIFLYEYSTNGVNWFTMTEKTGLGSSGTTSLIFASAGTSYNFVWDIGIDLPNTQASAAYVRLQSSDGLTNSAVSQSSSFAVDTLGPVISNVSVSQTTGTDLLTINYDIADQSIAGNNVVLEISSNGGSSWDVTASSVTGDVGSNVSVGNGKTITWNAGVDYNNQENNTMQVRLRGTDEYNNTGDFINSANFTVDTLEPVVSAVSASQNAGSSNVVINYTVTDISAGGLFTEFQVSSDGGSTWNVATSTFSGDAGSGVSTGVKSIVWNAGVDFSGQFETDMKVRVRSTDYYNHQGSFVNSANFTLDTKAPVVSAVTAAQVAGSRNINIGYNISDDAANNLVVQLDISENGGTSWTVATTTIAGDVGSGQSTGVNKQITWNAETDFPGQEVTNMRVRIRAVDSFANASGNFSSADFAVDTKAPAGLANLTKFSATDTTVTMNWNVASDTSFDHYELWYGPNEGDVQTRSIGTATKWDATDDPALATINTISTVITGITLTSNLYVKIWAIDDFGNESTVADINVFETPAVVVETVPSGGGGGAVTEIRTTPITKPILSPLSSPTRSTSANISGLAEPRTRIDLYDNGVLVGRLLSVTDNLGQFSQNFNFAVGNHVLTVRAIDFADNVSVPSDPVNLQITSGVLAAPTIVTPQNNARITEETPTIAGTVAPLTEVEVTVDNNTFTTIAGDNGIWQLVLPSTAALRNGVHRVAARAVDAAGNVSPSASISLNKVAPVVVAVPTSPTTIAGGAVVVPPTLPIPPASLIRENTEAIELPGVQVPQVTAVNTVVSNNNFSFSGTSLPNQDVIVYIHSDQALIYRTRTDNKGVWSINHSQLTTELTPGDHTIYAVAVDPVAKVKSRPSPVSMFTVKRNFWVSVFDYLNLQTTVVTLGFLSMAIFWLYRIRRQELARARK